MRFSSWRRAVLALLCLSALACSSKDGGAAGQAAAGVGAGGTGAGGMGAGTAPVGGTAAGGVGAGTGAGGVGAGTNAGGMGAGAAAGATGGTAGTGVAGTVPIAGTLGTGGDLGTGAIGGTGGGVGGTGAGAMAGTGAGAAGAAGTSPDDRPPAGTVPIDAPAASGCVTDVGAGDHTFTCQGVSFMLMVDPRCTEYACGLIVDVHGASMTGQIMRTNNRLHELAPPEGYLTVHPTAPSSAWDLATHPAIIGEFMDDVIAAFHVDENRVHVTGFSMGSATTFWFLCNRPEMLASAGPVTGSSADQVTVAATGDNCIESIDANWMPRVPTLFMSGSVDNALTVDAARARTDGIVMRLGLTGGDEIDSGDSFTRKRWTDGNGMVFDYLEHDLSSLILQGHCIPGPAGDAIFGCAGGNLDWGQTVLEFFIEHPRR
jgi:poly(3-hydroxybutyrate) depolymerase